MRPKKSAISVINLNKNYTVQILIEPVHSDSKYYRVDRKIPLKKHKAPPEGLRLTYTMELEEKKQRSNTKNQCSCSGNISFGSGSANPDPVPYPNSTKTFLY
jgi:hypothetical protein